MVYKSPFPAVPICNESLHKKLLTAIWNHGNLHPTKLAMVSADDETKSLTFHELHAMAHRVRGFLRSRNFKEGDVACLVLSNSIEWAVFQLGAMAAGGVVSGASALFTDYELERQFLDSGCCLILTDEDNLEKVMEATKKRRNVKTIICLRSCYSDGEPLPAGIIEWKDVISCKPDYDVPEVDPGSMAALPYSSGTTGPPKGVMLSHRSIGTQIDMFIDHINREFISVMGARLNGFYDETVLVHLPMYHMFGFGIINISFASGSKAVIMERFDPEVFLSAIQKHRPRVLITVPPVLLFLSKFPIVKEFDLSSIEVVMCGAAPLGKDACREFRSQHANVKYLCQGYGMTEVTIGSHLPVLDVPDTHLTVGKAAANVEMKIMDVKTGKECATGEQGELWVRTPTVMMGYLNRPKETAETLDTEGWLHTGDIGLMSMDGRTYI
ncbi:hypothetical protein PMAYCL1PPCAC_20902, partial [Pristionchus mayeri]